MRETEELISKIGSHHILQEASEKLVDVMRSSWILNFIAPVFFRNPILYLRVTAND